jgi:hypothetical protein
VMFNEISMRDLQGVVSSLPILLQEEVRTCSYVIDPLGYILAFNFTH